MKFCLFSLFFFFFSLFEQFQADTKRKQHFKHQTSKRTSDFEQLSQGTLKQLQLQFHHTFIKKKKFSGQNWNAVHLEANEYTNENWESLCATLWSRLTGEENKIDCGHAIINPAHKSYAIKVPLVSNRAAHRTKVLRCDCRKFNDGRFYTIPYNATEYFIMNPIAPRGILSLFIVQYVTDVPAKFFIKHKLPDLNE